MAKKDVKINVSDKEKKGDGWKEVTASDGSTCFWYKWLGGNKRPSTAPDGEGNNEFNADHTVDEFDVTFAGSDGGCYKFTAFLNKTETTPTEVTGVVAADGSSITVTDQCTTVQDYSWGATIETKSPAPKVHFNVDPVISNRGISVV